MRLTILLALSALVSACSYSPNPEPGALQCSDQHTCPKGFECVQPQNTCWRKGELPNDAGADSHVDGGDARGDVGDAANPALKFIGHWVFDTTGKLDETCNNVALPSASLANDYIDITAGTVTPLIGSYYCNWNLSLGATDKTRTVIMPGQSCQTMSGTMTVTMTGDQFDFQTTDGVAALVTASFTAVSISGPAQTCTFKITGKLNAMP